MNLKQIRDAIKNSQDEKEKAHLQEQWNELHQQMEDEQALDDENWEVCGG